MALRAVEKRSLPDKVFEQITAEIVSGRYAPGATIPSERELSELMGVNRHVVREAVKRLEQIGLVKVVQGGRTTVLDFRQSAGLDLLALVAEHAEAVEALLPLLAGALEMRVGIGVDVARLCAQRASSDVKARGCSRSPRNSRRVAEGVELLALDQRFWQRVLDGAGNLAYQLAFNSLIRAVHARHAISLPWIEEELSRSDYRRPIAAAIAAGDAESAATAARLALTPPDGYPLLAKRQQGAKRELGADPLRLPREAHLQPCRAHPARCLLERVHGALLATRRPRRDRARAGRPDLRRPVVLARPAATAGPARGPAVRGVGNPQIPAPPPRSDPRPSAWSCTGRSSTATIIAPLPI